MAEAMMRVSVPSYKEITKRLRGKNVRLLTERLGLFQNDLEWLLVDFEFDTALAQFASLQIHLEHTQAAMPAERPRMQTGPAE
jgi:hypothetical protein